MGLRDRYFFYLIRGTPVERPCLKEEENFLAELCINRKKQDLTSQREKHLQRLRRKKKKKRIANWSTKLLSKKSQKMLMGGLIMLFIYSTKVNAIKKFIVKKTKEILNSKAVHYIYLDLNNIAVESRNLGLIQAKINSLLQD